MTAPLTVLDEQTRDDLTPPCDAGKVPCYCPGCGGAVTGRHSCDQPATRVIRSLCGNGSPVICCERHSAEAARSCHIEPCQGCGAFDCVSVVPL